MFKFEENEVNVLEVDGKVLFEIYSTGVALGYGRIKTVKGKEYFEIRKDRIHKVIENAGISTFPHRGEKYLTESQLYDFMLEARTDKCREFRKWVTEEVLPTMNKTGAYVIEGREEEMVNLYFPSFSDEIKLGMVQDLMKQNKDLKVKADKYGDFMDKDGTFGFRDLVKHLNGLGFNVKETEVREILKDKNIIVKQGKKYVPSQDAVRNGLGLIKDEIIKGNNIPVSRYTEKLRDELIEELKVI